eukprot:688935-Prymnesium_polylepis.3
MSGHRVERRSSGRGSAGLLCPRTASYCASIHEAEDKERASRRRRGAAKPVGRQQRACVCQSHPPACCS